MEDDESFVVKIKNAPAITTSMITKIINSDLFIDFIMILHITNSKVMYNRFVNIQKIYFAGGCFWCTEAVFQRLKGVTSVVSGYANGDGSDPSYEDVSSGETGFAEAIEVTYDPDIISLEKLLKVFWATHDATSLNQQGADKGTQYRSAVFYSDEIERNVINRSKSEEGNSDKIVTIVEPLKNFYKAEDYHQNYYNQNKDTNGYCPVVITPKIQKLLHSFNEEVKEEFKI